MSFVLSSIILVYILASCPKPKYGLYLCDYGSREQLIDCDGDKIPDYTCSDTSGRLGVVQTSSNCELSLLKNCSGM